MHITGNQIHNDGGMDGYSSKCLLLSIQRYICMRGIDISSDFLLDHFDARHYDMILADEAFVEKLKELLEIIGLVVDKFIVLNILIDGRYHIGTYFHDYLTREVTIYTDIDFDEVFSNAIVVVGTGTHFELLENVHFVVDEGEIEEREDKEMARQLQEQIEQQEQDEEMARQLQEQIEQQEKDEEMARQLQQQFDQEEQDRTHITEEERRIAFRRSIIPSGPIINQDVVNYTPPLRRQGTYLSERERFELLSRLFNN